MRAKLHHPKSAPKVHLCTLIVPLAASIIALLHALYGTCPPIRLHRDWSKVDSQEVLWNK